MGRALTFISIFVAFFPGSFLESQNFNRDHLLWQSLAAKRANNAITYIGDDACRSCHQEKVETFHETAHHLTSRLPSKTSIAGSFSPGSNTLPTANPNLLFKMEATEQGFFQSAVVGRPPNLTTHSEPFGVVIGSGRKGQTYLYWKEQQLFQLPVSYWTELNEWVNSPGYQDGTADFNRRVPPRCLECHASYFHSLAPPVNRYSKTDFVLGIACERCHGPAAGHVTRSRQSSPASGETIINPAKLPRDRQLDLCALCHAGPGEPALAPAFSFVVGNRVDDYLQLEPIDPDAPLDVHGNQVGLLKKSRCFQESNSMTCSTCHDVHKPQRDLAAMSDRCLSCHKADSCGMRAKMGRQILGKCVDCHMPNQPTQQIISTVTGRKVQPKVRNHWIKVYAEIPTKKEERP
ncbi:MAG TPA: multiheme c-type cytochrome [Terriglobales bacterium]|nr:multiheme c-type cytochrome [Terriglobales bacterium]